MTPTPEAPDRRWYCSRCDYYTDHVSTAHDGLAARGLIHPPETPAGGLTTAIQDVLAAHRWRHTRATHCACGFRTPLAQLAVDGYERHVAELVAAAVVQARAEDRARIEATLARHLFTLYPGQIACDCEWTQEDEDTRAGEGRMIAAHIAHVAAALTATEDGNPT